MDALSDELVASIIVGVVIPLVLKIVQHYFPWLTIDNPTAPKPSVQQPPEIEPAADAEATDSQPE